MFTSERITIDFREILETHLKWILETSSDSKLSKNPIETQPVFSYYYLQHLNLSKCIPIFQVLKYVTT